MSTATSTDGVGPRLTDGAADCYDAIVSHARTLGFRCAVLSDAIGHPDFVLDLPAIPGRRRPHHLVVVVTADGIRLSERQQASVLGLIEQGVRFAVVSVPSQLPDFVQTMIDLAQS